jgi:hypothetical protein
VARVGVGGADRIGFMSAVVVALMVLVILLVGLGAVLLATRALQNEAARVRASRTTTTSSDRD